MKEMHKINNEWYFASQQESPECKSLLKKYLTREVVDQCKGLRTKLGATLLDVIQSGVANLDSGVGVYAPDAEAYTLFKPLFDPIIKVSITIYKDNIL